MNMNINVWGIETNNLKNIDISIRKNSINLIIGPSGSGKSSLAYDTIAKIGQHEFLSMFADNISEPKYRIKGYENMVAAVPIKQSNFNHNMRSTIGTYFGLNRNVALLYAAVLGIDEEFFVLNKESNLCESCNGLGFKKVLDINKLINYDIPLEKNPIRCWNKYKDFYSQIIKKFCEDNSIDSRKNFRQLSKSEKELILFGESKNKYTIKYKKLNSLSSRTTKYYGVLTEKPMLTNFKPSSQFYSDKECEVCKGKKYSLEHDKYRVLDHSIGQFMMMPFNKLEKHLEKLMIDLTDEKLLFSLKNIFKFISKANELNLGYLYLNRAIPTLSGGELQRLRMVQVFNTQLSDLMLVLDEPLAGLSGIEKKAVYECIINLEKKHTLLIVDHSDIFVNNAKNIIALGECGGKNGGYLIDAKTYLKTQSKKHALKVCPPTEIIKVALNSSIYLYKGVNIEIGKECMNLITGHSGIGKSTLLREYLPQSFEQYNYISQKPLLGNKNSSVATALDIFVNISSLFAKKYNKDKRFFSNQTGCEGACPVCMGAGYLEYADSQGNKVQLECRECQGTGFNKNLKKYTLSGKTLFEVWTMTIDEAKDFFLKLDNKIYQTLEEANSIMIGHLQLGQPISTLSGGENIRIKLLKSIKSSAKILGIDEPFRGLNNSEVFCIIQYLDKLRANGKTILVSDHNEYAVQFFAKRIELINENNVLTFKKVNDD